MARAQESDNARLMLSWFHQLDRAASASEVINVCREYLATWPPEELALLPSECRPGRIKSHADVEALHSCLVEEYRSNRLTGERLATLQRMTSFVVRASVRLAQLHVESEPEGEEVPPAAERRSASIREQ